MKDIHRRRERTAEKATNPRMATRRLPSDYAPRTRAKLNALDVEEPGIGLRGLIVWLALFGVALEVLVGSAHTHMRRRHRWIMTRLGINVPTLNQFLRET